MSASTSRGVPGRWADQITPTMSSRVQCSGENAGPAILLPSHAITVCTALTGGDFWWYMTHLTLHMLFGLFIVSSGIGSVDRRAYLFVYIAHNSVRGNYENHDKGSTLWENEQKYSYSLMSSTYLVAPLESID